LDAKILIVDDEPNLLRMVGFILQEEGYEIAVAQNGLEALKKVQTVKPDLMILDIMMPDMSGFEVCEQIRKNPETVELPIIMLTAKALVADKIKGLDAGADEYMVKPVKAEEIVARVRSLLKRSRQLSPKKTPIKGVILAFMGAKGGVGTTTVALNVAAEFFGQSKNVLAVELRGNYGTFSAQLNLPKGFSLANAFEPDQLDINKQKLIGQVVTNKSGLKVLQGPQNAQEFHEISTLQANTILDTFHSMEDYLILDLPSYPSEANRAAIQHCKFLGLVIEPERGCLISARVMKELLLSWGLNANQIGVIVVRRDPNSVIKTEEIQSYLETEIIGFVPPAVEALILAQKKGEPIVTSLRDNYASVAFIDIAKKLSNH
jgi:CheY-like chemotaxis protein/MinD-like ATPase involved in chromosome partitioning or flagellar assembly